MGEGKKGHGDDDSGDDKDDEDEKNNKDDEYSMCGACHISTVIGHSCHILMACSIHTL